MGFNLLVVVLFTATDYSLVALHCPDHKGCTSIELQAWDVAQARGRSRPRRESAHTHTRAHARTHTHAHARTRVHTDTHLAFSLQVPSRVAPSP